MDQFVTILKPSSLRVANAEKDKQRATLKYNPYGNSKVAERKITARGERRRTDK
jgi:hypothetical protein